MNSRKSINPIYKRVAGNVLSIFVILALALPATGYVFAQEELPYLRAFPDQDSVDGSRWPPEQQINLTINAIPFEPQISDGDGNVSFDLAGYDLNRGDTLIMSSIGVSPVVYMARQLFVDNFDLDEQSISGSVDGQQTIHVWVGDADEYLDSDEDGNWTVNLSGYDNVLYPGACGNAEAWDAWGAQTSDSSTIVDWCVPPWRDEFDGSLADGWYWVGNINTDNWALVDGTLRIDASTLGTGGENLLQRSIAAGDFSIETRVFFAPDTNFQFAGLVIWQDGSNFLQFGRAFCNPEYPNCVGNGIYFDYAYTGGELGALPNFATTVDNPSEAYLRLERRGEMIRAFFSYEGITWFEIGTHWIPPEFQVNGVGLTNSQDTSDPPSGKPAYFEYFELTEGWGFLPEGFHDYDGGDVPSWACNAGGWAADPDDPGADLAIEVNVDDWSLPKWLYAGDYRKDLDDAGVCVDGYCGFSTSLWDFISHYETHTITAYAQDIPSGEWVRLSASPKDLTCRTYDIYAYDPLTGATTLLTNLPDAHEFNPSWSPNGKMIAHDVADLDFNPQGIYITDVKTGVSTPLAGAESGNDAVWSQNGKWIAYDQIWFDDDENLHGDMYIIPATGGTPMMVRNEAVSADWAPNGKRLVFQDTIDNSVRTIAVDGGKDGETIVAPIGFNPVWSPDGNWIAYENDGDIWKVYVNVQGKVFGDPIQVTSGPFNDGQPTWSPDSTTIVYHSGFNEGDWDLWSVPAEGGTSTWLTGGVVFGDYDPSYANNSPTIGYASFSPNGQAERTWAAAFTFDAGIWDTGEHTYQFWAQGEPIGDEFSFNVSSGEPLYDGYALIRPRNWLVAQTSEGCDYISAINPDQETRFYIGWTFDGIYTDAPAYYESLNPQIRWDATGPADMLRHDIIPYSPNLDWFGYTCTYTSP